MSKTKKCGAAVPLQYTQNFLTARATIRQALARTSLCKADHVLEIGPGKGHITRELARTCNRVSAVELDAALYRRLCSLFANAPQVTIHHADFLNWQLPGEGNYKVFANIPFAGTTAIVQRLTQAKNPPQELWLLMEKGAAKRFCGKPHEGMQSLLLKPYYTAEICFHFRRESFHPMPAVEVVLLHLQKKQSPDLLPQQRARYRRFLEHCLPNPRRGLRQYLSPKQISRALQAQGLQNDRQSKTMRYVQWLCLFRCSCQYGSLKK